MAIERLQIAMRSLAMAIERLQIATRSLAMAIERLQMAMQSLAMAIERLQMAMRRSPMGTQRAQTHPPRPMAKVREPPRATQANREAVDCVPVPFPCQCDRPQDTGKQGQWHTEKRT